MIFLRGVLKSGERSLFTFSGTIKRVKWKTAGKGRRRCHLAAQRSKATPRPRLTRSSRLPPAQLARLRAAAGAGVLLEFDLSADQDRPRLDPADHLHLGALADRGRLSARDPARARHANSGGCQGLEAVRAAADHQFDDSVPDDHLGAAICGGGADRGAGLDHADLRLPHHLGHHPARAGHAAETRRRRAGARRNRRDHRPRLRSAALGGNIFAEMVILLATVSFACATIFGLRLTEYDPMVVAAGSLLFGGLVLLPVALIVDHPWTLRPTAEALVATVAMGIFSSALRADAVLHVPDAARHAHHQRARLFAHSDRRRPVGACCSAKPCRPIWRSASSLSWPASPP